MLLALALPEAILTAAVIIAVAIVAAAWILVKRRKGAEMSSQVEFPQSEEGTPVEPSGIAVESETPLEVGTTVLAFSHERWWRAEVIGLEPGDRVRIHFPGWESKWDIVVRRGELQVDLNGPG